MRPSILAIVVIAAALSGCVVGPNYSRPAVATPAAYRAPATASATRPAPEPTAASLADLRWFEVFHDPKLQELIRVALVQNYDLLDAVVRVEQARANLGIVHSNELPEVGGGASLQLTRLSRNGQIPISPAFVSSQNRNWGQATLNLLSYEIDLWGRLRRETEAARAGLFNADENRKAVVSSLVAEVAAAYFQLQQLDFQLEIANRTLDTRRESLRLVQERRAGGVATLLDLRQAEELVSTAAQRVPVLRQQIEQTENRVSLLLGRSPGEVIRGQGFLDQEIPPDVPAGLPSSLLDRRPDIRAAEQALIAANANIGAARAAYFPRISLTGLLGGQSTGLTSLFSGPNNAWSFVPQISQPIFTGGRLRSNVKFAEAERDRAVIAYRRSIQSAFREVSDALVARLRSRESRLEQERLVAALQDRKRLAYVRYRGGVDTQLNALDADRDLFDAELALAAIRYGELLSVVQLYKALGGGWQ